jgi:homocysteine S-methyltransferase
LRGLFYLTGFQNTLNLVKLCEKEQAMSFESMLNSGRHILSQGSVYELLRRSPEVVYDEHIFHAGLIYDPGFAQVLEGVYRAYIDTAVASGFDIAVGTPTWRANAERIAASAFADRAVNEDNVRFLREIRDDYADAGVGILIEGDFGPRGDAYRPEEALEVDSARAFHLPQVDALAASGVDYLQGSTFPALSEAMGASLAMAQTGLPYAISFVVDRSGHLLDGTRLGEAIACIDDRVGASSARYAINCVHPRILQQALDLNPEIEGRIVSFHANTADLAAAELDGSEELITEEPRAFARAYAELLGEHDIRIVGGCCGSNPDHIRAIASVLNANGY